MWPRSPARPRQGPAKRNRKTSARDVVLANEFGVGFLAGSTVQSEPCYDRMLRRANKLRMALGGKPGTAN